MRGSNGRFAPRSQTTDGREARTASCGAAIAALTYRLVGLSDPVARREDSMAPAATGPARLGIPARIAHVEGDDLQPRAAQLGLGEPLTANAYLGAWGIVDCLDAGADVVVTGRVTDASVTVGAAAAHFGWGRTDYHQLAGA